MWGWGVHYLHGHGAEEQELWQRSRICVGCRLLRVRNITRLPPVLQFTARTSLFILTYHFSNYSIPFLLHLLLPFLSSSCLFSFLGATSIVFSTCPFLPLSFLLLSLLSLFLLPLSLLSLSPSSLSPPLFASPFLYPFLSSFFISSLLPLFSSSPFFPPSSLPPSLTGMQCARTVLVSKSSRISKRRRRSNLSLEQREYLVATCWVCVPAIVSPSTTGRALT